ncbi:outer membrane lipoprotein chaperone LolA [Lentisalinibacter orientalis]|uniref:outer membrane lipoprotein chaperone LolA n=1 Tax=Lentisalinibacter orientalis TaxID=2992241 RepID=UPI003863874C
MRIRVALITAVAAALLAALPAAAPLQAQSGDADPAAAPADQAGQTDQADQAGQTDQADQAGQIDQADQADPGAAGREDLRDETRVPAQLRQFFADIDTIRGEFRQVLFDTRGEAVERSAGEFAILKPGRFRWEYTEPYEQLIVANGDKIWLYDADFEQVTVREQTDSLSQSPAMLLGGDAAALEAFRYLGSYSRDGRDWLRLEPVAPESDFRAVSLSFAGGELEMMELTDALGQVTRIEFTELVTNDSLDAALFTFEPPPGVDVIGVGESSAATPTATGSG